MKNLICFDTSRPVREIFDITKSWNIDYLVLSTLFFESPENRDYIKGCHENSKNGDCPKLWLNIPVFCNPGYLENHEDAFCITSQNRKAAFHDWLHFVCPNNNEYLEQRIKESRLLVRELQPEIVSLDFIRQFVFWEEIAFSDSIEDGCYCPHCRSLFAGDANIRTIPSIEEIHSLYMKDWVKWRSKRIAEVAIGFKKAIYEENPRIKFTMKLLPFKKDDYDGAVVKHAGQDLNLLAPLCDFLSPMTFYNMFAKSLSWKHEICSYMHQESGLDVMDYCQDREVYEFEASITKSRFASELDDAVKRTLEHDWYLGTTIFFFESILKDPVRITAIKNYEE